jgi:hypothetical protein
MKHGHKRTGKASPEYKTWLGMKARCYREKNKDYPNWGGKGIRVCDKWVNNFMAFYTDMGPKPSPQHTIDRCDSSKNYSPDNCRWATFQQQGGENRKGLKEITVNGQYFPTLKAACDFFGIRQTTLNERIRLGVPQENLFHKGRLKSRRDKQSYWKKELRS